MGCSAHRAPPSAGAVGSVVLQVLAAVARRALGAGQHGFRKRTLQFSQSLRSASVGELVDVGGALQGGFGLVSGMVSLLALGLYALLQGDRENNDDDDNHGGGLMQPVA